MTMFKRILRIVLYTLLVLVAAVVGALVVLTKTERGRDNLAGLISAMASTDDRKVTVSGIDGIWSGALTVDHVVLEDRQGAWLVARKVAVDWSPLALLSKSFSAGRIAADRIEPGAIAGGRHAAEPRWCHHTAGVARHQADRPARNCARAGPGRQRHRRAGGQGCVQGRRGHWRSKRTSTSPAMMASKARSTPTSISHPPTTSSTST